MTNNFINHQIIHNNDLSEIGNYTEQNFSKTIPNGTGLTKIADVVIPKGPHLLITSTKWQANSNGNRIIYLSQEDTVPTSWDGGKTTTITSKPVDTQTFQQHILFTNFTENRNFSIDVVQDSGNSLTNYINYKLIKL